MNVSLEKLKEMRPGQVKPFLCDTAKAMFSGCSLVTFLKRTGLPEGIADYETQKDFGDNILLVRAMGEGDTPILNR